MRRYFLMMILIITLISCSEMPEKSNPCDPAITLEAPTELTVIQLDLTNISLLWEDNCPVEYGYVIDREIDGVWSDGYGITAENVEFWSDTLAAVNAVLRYRVKAYAGDNHSEAAVSDTLNNILPKVAALTIGQMDVSHFNLHWDQFLIRGEDGFIIERKIDAGEFSEIAFLPEDRDWFYDNINESRGFQNVYYRVYTCVGEERSAAVEISSEVIFPAPGDLQYEKLAVNRIKLTWDDNSVGGAGFVIDKNVDGVWTLGYAQVSGDILAWIDETANINCGLQYRIYAWSGENTSNSLTSGLIDNTFPVIENLSIEQVNVHTFQLNWEQDHIIGEDGFLLERSIDDGIYIQIADLPADTDEFLDDINVRDSVGTVHYRLRGYLADDYSDYVMTVCAINLQPPSDLQYHIINIDQIRLNWTDNSNGEEGFCIDRKIGDNLWHHRYHLTEENITTWLDENVPVDRNITYRIMAYAGEYESEYIESDLIDTSLPEIADLSIEPVNIHTFQIDWQQDHILAEEGFIIYRSINDNDFVMLAELVPDTETYTDDICLRDMLNSIAYKVCIDFGEHISDGVIDSLETEIPAPDYTGYGRIAVNCVRIHWIDNAEGEDGYIIDRSASGSGYIAGLAITGENVEEWLDEDVPVNEIITYRLRTFAGIYQSTYEPGTAIHNDLPTPSNVNYLILSLNQIELSWACNCFGQSGYKIDKKVGDEDWIEEYGVTEGAIYSWIDEEVEVNELISYRVYIYLEDEVSDYVLIEDIDTTIPPPSDLEYEHVNIYTIQLTWQDNSVGEEGFKIDKRVGTGAWISEYAVLNENIVSWSDVEAEINEDLQYRVYGYYEDEESSSVQTGVIDNTFPAPQNLELEELGGYEIMLTWEYEIDGIEGFRIEKKAFNDEWELYEDIMNPSIRFWNDFNPNILDKYKIKAYYQSFESEPSNEVTAFSDFVFIQTGTFTWGEDDEILTMDHDFVIMKNEVTNEQYGDYLESALEDGLISISGSSVIGYYLGDEYWTEGDYEYYNLDESGRIDWDGINFIIEEGFENHPVVEVSWFGANAYAEYYGWRLPTEQEWEMAARGITGFDYPWGDELSGERANYSNSGDPWDNGTTPVGYYNGENGTIDSPSPYGCYDMCGNVWDWTESWIYTSQKVLKGGSWYITESMIGWLCSWFVDQDNPTGSGSSVGFRCVKTIE
ncbi:MAG: formylglycine-generating enzyme family protein [Candidatus Cloacimonetes bacterium]|nr:formylglycine-generating enzyme family protein [Candidatus Cloacimonadota bacterium]